MLHDCLGEIVWQTVESADEALDTLDLLATLSSSLNTIVTRSPTDCSKAA